MKKKLLVLAILVLTTIACCAQNYSEIPIYQGKPLTREVVWKVGSISSTDAETVFSAYGFNKSYINLGDSTSAKIFDYIYRGGLINKVVYTVIGRKMFAMWITSSSTVKDYWDEEGYPYESFVDENKVTLYVTGIEY